MKRVIALFLIVTTVFSFAGCSKNGKTLNVPENYVASDITMEEDYGFTELKTATSEIDYIALKEGACYGFNSLRCFEYDYDNTKYTAVILSDMLYAPAEGLADAVGFEFDGETDAFKKDTISFTVSTKKDTVTYNGNEKTFHKAVEIDGKIYVNVENFAKLFGFSYTFDDDSGVAFLKGSYGDGTLETAIERFEFYEANVYTTETVECDTTGVGVYKASKEKDRLVGVSYATWFYEGRRWGGWSTWDMPLLGSYTSYDEDVIRQHGEWLRDAGVDFVFVDWSNDVSYDPDVGTTKWTGLDYNTVEKATETLFEVWSELEGAPKICIFTGPGHDQSATNDVIANGTMAKKTQQIYDTFLANEKFAEQYFYYEGKPLLMCYAATPAFFDSQESPYEDDRFTIRWVTGYVGQQSTLYDEETLASYMMWSWEERGAQTYAVNGKYAECMTVCASTRAQGEEGDSGYIAAAGRENGLTFRKQWARAQAVGVKVALVVSWNEWTTAEQYSAEVSKDIEPSEIYGTLYLDILRNQVRIFKGQA